VEIALTNFGRLSLTALVIVLVVAGCGASTSTNAKPCAFLSQPVAAQISGDASITNQVTDLREPLSGYVACTFADTRNEANSVEVQLKSVTGGVTPAALHAAATFFSRGEPVQPFQTFPVAGLGPEALGESTLGVALVVFAKGDVLIYVGARSASRSVLSLRASVALLGRRIATALTVTR
jgi:hypothetical protein